MFFKKKNLSPDVVILINEREIRELPVDDENEEAISAGGLSLPKADAEVRYFPSGGRAFIYGCTPAYLAECENVARLEQSTVLRNLFDYGATGKTANIQFYVMMAVLIITIFLLRG
ncbi:MAG: hypothetical protein ACOX4Q_09105 [Syntrophomonadales bacterium]|jgi:hypothetical protein